MNKSKKFIFCLLLTSFFHLNYALAADFSSKIIHYGNSLSGKKLVAKIFFKKGIELNSFILLTEGIHGNEYLKLVKGIEGNIIKHSHLLGFKDFFNSGGVIMTIPQVNKDGVIKRTRTNLQSYDLNRKFMTSHKHLKNEATMLMSFIDKFITKTNMTLLFAMDYHCCGGAALKPRNDSANISLYQLINAQMQENLHRSYRVTSTKNLFKKIHEGTLKDYLFEKYKTPSITFESIAMDSDLNIKGHINFWNNILQYFVLKNHSSKDTISKNFSSLTLSKHLL